MSVVPILQEIVCRQFVFDHLVSINVEIIFEHLSRPTFQSDPMLVEPVAPKGATKVTMSHVDRRETEEKDTCSLEIEGDYVRI